VFFSNHAPAEHGRAARQLGDFFYRLIHRGMNMLEHDADSMKPAVSSDQGQPFLTDIKTLRARGGTSKKVRSPPATMRTATRC
jgi:hypothetical protein